MSFVSISVQVFLLGTTVDSPRSFAMMSIRAVALALLMAVLALFLQGCSEESDSTEAVTTTMDANMTTTMMTTTMDMTTTTSSMEDDNETNSSRLLL